MGMFASFIVVVAVAAAVRFTLGIITGMTLLLIVHLLIFKGNEIIPILLFLVSR